MKFTIIIPAYKPAFLAQAVSSALNQEGFEGEWEVLVVNDASPFDVDGALASFMSNPRLRYHRNKVNFGADRLVDNWNSCLSMARGRYVINMGDDDRLLPNALATYSALIDRHPGLAVYHGRTRVIDEQGRTVDITPTLPEVESVAEAMYRRLVEKRGSWIGDYVFDTEILRADGGYYFLPRAWGSDDVTVWRAAAHAGMGGTAVPVFEYRVNSLTLSSNVPVEAGIAAIDGREQWISSFLAAYRPPTPDDAFYAARVAATSRLRVEWAKQFLIGNEVWPFNASTLMKWLTKAPDYGVSRKRVIAAFAQQFKKHKID